MKEIKNLKILVLLATKKQILKFSNKNRVCKKLCVNGI